MLAEGYDIDLDDPVGQLIEEADRFLSSNKNQIISGFAQALGSFLHPGPRQPQVVFQSAPQQPRPAPRPVPPPAPPPESPRDVLGFGKDVKLTREIIKKRQRDLARMWHSDTGGSDKAMQRLNAATDELLKTVK